MILSMYNFISNYWGNRGKPCISLKTSAFPVSKETLNYVLFNANLNWCKFHFGNIELNWKINLCSSNLWLLWLILSISLSRSFVNLVVKLSCCFVGCWCLKTKTPTVLATVRAMTILVLYKMVLLMGISCCEMLILCWNK